jgi:hypothetical protein
MRNWAVEVNNRGEVVQYFLAKDILTPKQILGIEP